MQETIANTPSDDLTAGTTFMIEYLPARTESAVFLRFEESCLGILSMHL